MTAATRETRIRVAAGTVSTREVMTVGVLRARAITMPWRPGNARSRAASATTRLAASDSALAFDDRGAGVAPVPVVQSAFSGMRCSAVRVLNGPSTPAVW